MCESIPAVKYRHPLGRNLSVKPTNPEEADIGLSGVRYEGYSEYD